MKKIGSGVQYDVYDLGNGRVRKIETSLLVKIIRFHRIAPKYKIYLHPIHNIRTAIGAGKMTKDSVDYLRRNSNNIDLSLLGNPSINDLGYDQDFAPTLGERLFSVDFEMQKRLVDGYMNNILMSWDFGFSDTNFNFMINSGVNNKGEVILADLGELSWNKDEVYKLVKSKHWEKRSSFNKMEEGALKKYFQEQFNDQITIDNLENRWKSKINE